MCVPIYIYICNCSYVLLSLRNNFAFFFLFLTFYFCYDCCCCCCFCTNRTSIERTKEKSLLPIVVMHAEMMTDTPRYCDYVYAVCE